MKKISVFNQQGFTDKDVLFFSTILLSAGEDTLDYVVNRHTKNTEWEYNVSNNKSMTFVVAWNNDDPYNFKFVELKVEKENDSRRKKRSRRNSKRSKKNQRSSISTKAPTPERNGSLPPYY